uniref:Uncharacterized protein n=1 Tax=Mucochytrium quahogii TaxID=96639 RepID=A0A7S2SEK6_9STRA|mmetsp:Transcript_13752/g.24444  ORF Transcript_13752/g.24444 Transcript_13752/m.24444 type:complete len:385 (-) Transcript_13752:367-1521(-)
MKCTLAFCLVPLALANLSTRPSTPMADAQTPQEDKKLQKLVDAWNDENGGILFHGTSSRYASYAAQHKVLHVENDCGAMCAAWSYTSSRLPMVPFDAAFFLMVKANSSFVKQYAHGMSPHDAASVARQFCVKGNSKQKTWEKIHRSPYWPKDKTGGHLGCGDNMECQYIAAGGGTPRQILKLDKQKKMVYDVYRLNSTSLAKINQGKCHECGTPHRCSTFRPEIKDGTSYMKYVIDKGLTQPKQFYSFMRNCRFDAQKATDWAIFKDAYIKFLERFKDGKPEGMDQLHRWNEVNLYRPPESKLQDAQNKLQEQALVGVFLTPGGNYSKATVNNAKRIVRWYNSKYTEAQIHLYNCSGRTQWADFDSSTRDPIIGPNGCSIIQVE